MRRTQLYLDDDLWSCLHAQARRERTTVSELVRRAARERYMKNPESRHAALMGIVGLWKDREDLPDTDAYVRGLRKSTRLKRSGIQ